MLHDRRRIPLPCPLLAAIGALLLGMATPALEAQAAIQPPPLNEATWEAPALRIAGSQAAEWTDAAPAGRHHSARLDPARGAGIGAVYGGVAGFALGAFGAATASIVGGGDGAAIVLLVGTAAGTAVGAAIGGIIGLVVRETD